MGCGASRTDLFPLDTLSTNQLSACSLCGQNLSDNHPWEKDPKTGLYQHKSCCAIVHAALLNQAKAEAKGAEDERNAVLEAHLYKILGIKPVSEDVTRYVSALRSEGCDLPADFDGMAVEDLAGPPFKFKRMHLKKVRAAKGAEENERNAALEAYLYSIFGIKPVSEDVTRYVSALRSQGFDTPEGLNNLTIQNLAAAPFNFKQGHLLRMSQARKKPESMESTQIRPELPAVRGLCSLCGVDVYDSQPRLKDHSTGQYQHADCHANEYLSAHESAARPTSTVASSLAIIKANANAAAAVEETQAEVAAIMAAADAAHAEAKRQAKEALAKADANAVQIKAAAAAAAAAASTAAAAAAAAAAAQTAAVAAAAHAPTMHSTGGVVISDSTPARSSSAYITTTNHGFTTRKPFLPAAPKIKQLLPDGKHAFLSYQWDVQKQVKEIKERLNERKIKCWMDVDGGMKSDIYDSMAEGVQGAACVVCFMTQAYQDSANCKLELKFAQQSGVPIIPVMMQANFTAKGWLGILTSGSVWTPMYDNATVPDGIEKLIAQGQHLVPGMRGEDDVSDTMSDASGDGSSFDVGGWGDEMFSLAEMREELDRLREDSAPSSGASKHADDDSGGLSALCPLPAIVPILPRGLFVTAEMQSVLDAVLSETSTPQIGFCGMGGIGKTTVSCWVTRNDAVRTKFRMVAWITLGQTPVLNSCVDLLHQQLTGSSLPSGISSDQKHEFLQHGFLNQSVLLVLDDCWDADVVKHFNFIDQNTNSKILISSRVRDVLDGGQTIDVVVPSKLDAVKMLISTAGMDVDALKGRKEVAHIAELCKRLPLTIGVAGKLIRQLAQGSNMSEASEWTDIVSLLEEELNDPDGSMSIEESVIRASIKAIPSKLRKNITQLFFGFALVPEDTFVPLSVLGMVFHACGDAVSKSSEFAAKPISRMQVRRYLKVLIDRSLVLGTVDRPQLHDVMLDYVQKQLAGDAYKAAQRQLVEALRKSDRSRTTPIGKYIQHCVKHHIKESHDVNWERSEQAVSWIEDHVNGFQDVIAASAASIVPVEVLAKEAEAAEMYWEAALRWNANALLKSAESGAQTSGIEFVLLAVNASAKAVATLPNNSSADASSAGGSFTQFDLESFELFAFNIIMKTWNPEYIGLYGDRYRLACATEAGRSRPLMCYSAIMSLDWFIPLLAGDFDALAAANWKLMKAVLDVCDESTEAYARSSEENRAAIKPLMAWPLLDGGEPVTNTPGFSWDYFRGGDTLVDYFYSYEYEVHHGTIVELISGDTHLIGAEPRILALQFGRVEEAKQMMESILADAQLLTANPASAGYIHTALLMFVILPQAQHMLGLSKLVQTIFAIFGLTFENAETIIEKLTKPGLGSTYSAIGHKGTGPGTGGGPFALTRALWQVKAMFILHTDVPEKASIAWLKSLPDNDDYYAYTMTIPTHDLNTVLGYFQACWIALAHEKVGLYDSAIRFADLQLETDLLKGGVSLVKWSQVIALACKGRVFAKLNRHDEALIAFQTAIATSKESYSMMEAFALRELANYVGIGEAAVQAGKDLEAKLDTFKGRLTRAEFDGMTIAPGLNQILSVTVKHPSLRVLTVAATKPLLPDGKHAFLSYQWDVQEQVKEIKVLLSERLVKCWMDVDGGMKSNIYDSMAEGLQGAACVVCFMTQAYQDSANCKLELQFAQQSGVPIIPVMMQPNFTATGWLGILTSGSIWTPMYDRASVLDGIDKLIAQSKHLVPGMPGENDTSSDTMSEASGDGASFDVGAWGDDMFSYDDMREELERLREDSAPSAGNISKRSVMGEDGVSLCALPAMVPVLPRGLFVTPEMQSVLDAVVSDTSTPQIGFCGMGGIGKTTVSSWVTRNETVRTKFGMVAWITLGQTPVLASCMDLLHMQLTGSALPDGVPKEQKHELLQHAFLDQSALLILDDCWDADIVHHFNWIDKSSNSKILISSRVRDVLDGGLIVDVVMPSKRDAVKMLLSTAGMDVDALKERKEVAHVAELCKRLPLTIGVAGKLIRQLAQGSSMSEASDWTDVVALLEEELNDPDGSMSIEESVIRASIKAIPSRLRKVCTQLFVAFALVPEDTLVPLPVLGMVFDACGSSATKDDKASTTKPLSRLQVRRYLKVLIDRSLVLGTVDRPQLHDVMLDYVQKQLSSNKYRAAQRQLVESLRKSNRSKATPTGKYMQQCVRYHIKESYDEAWGKGKQAMSWIEDHVSGVQDEIAASTAFILPAEALANEAEAAEMYWQASLRWHALGLADFSESGNLGPTTIQYFKKAINASAKAVASSSSLDAGAGAGADGCVDQFDLDSFDLHVLNLILKSFSVENIELYSDRFRLACATDAGCAHPLINYSAIFSLDWVPGSLAGPLQGFADVSWTMCKTVLDMFNEETDAYARTTEEVRATIKPLLAWPFVFCGDAIINSPGFSWDFFGNGDILIDHYYSYDYDIHHRSLVEIVGADNHMYAGEAWVLAIQYGRVEEAKGMMQDQSTDFQKIASNPSCAGYSIIVSMALCMLSPAQHILGVSKHVQTVYAAAAITFDNAEDRLDTLTKPLQGGLFTGMKQRGTGNGLFSLIRMVWNLKAMCILHLDVPKSKSIAWLESLPDNETFYAYSMTMPTHDHCAMLISICWVALAHEKVGLNDGAIRFADLQLEPDLLKAASPNKKWSHVIALACKGRVFAKLNRHDEALIAFQTAVAVSKESYSLMEAFALRELANYAVGAGADDTAAQAAKDLELKLGTFEGRMTRNEFDTLRISP